MIKGVDFVIFFVMEENGDSLWFEENKAAF